MDFLTMLSNKTKYEHYKNNIFDTKYRYTTTVTRHTDFNDFKLDNNNVRALDYLYRIKLYHLYELDIPKGLVNQGNTCYYNAGLQFLYKIYELRGFLTDNRIKEQYKDGMFKNFITLLQNFQIYREGYYTYTKYDFGQACYYPAGEQQDAEESLSHLLQQMYIDCNNKHDYEANLNLVNVPYTLNCINRMTIRTFPQSDPRLFIKFNYKRNIISHVFGSDTVKQSHLYDHIFKIPFNETNLKPDMNIQTLINNKLKNIEITEREITTSVLSDDIIARLKQYGVISRNVTTGNVTIKNGIFSNNKYLSNYDFSATYDPVVGLSELDIIGDILNQFIHNKYSIKYEVHESNIDYMFNHYIIVQLSTLNYIYDDYGAFKMNKIKYTGDIFVDKELIINNKFYECVAIICHWGNEQRGHYTTYAKYNKKWYLFDDHIVTEQLPNWYKNLIESKIDLSTLSFEITKGELEFLFGESGTFTTPYLILYREILKNSYGKQVDMTFPTVLDSEITSDLQNYLVNTPQ